jgi:peroxiredoxin
MTTRGQWMLVGGVLAGLGLALWVASVAFEAELQPVDVGSPAPDFRAHVLNSTEMRSLADYKGSVILLNVWGTFCEPCKVEMPAMERLYRRRGPEGLRMVAISIDQAVPDSGIAAFVRELGLTFDILHDSAHAIVDQYRVTGWPETFIIDHRGIIRRKWIGEYNWDSAPTDSLIVRLLRERKGTAIRDTGTARLARRQ